MEEKLNELISYILECNRNNTKMNYITWDRRETPNVDIGYTILSKNEYCCYRGQSNWSKMYKLLEKNNHNEWLILIQNDMETSINGFNEKLVDRAISLIQYLYNYQDEIGFVLCIKIVRDTTNTIESHIYNITTIDYLELIKKYFENPNPWYVFVIPQ
jgi:hypothetical protein